MAKKAAKKTAAKKSAAKKSPAKKAAKKRLGDVALATPSAAAQDVIDIAGLGHVFDVFDDLVLATQSV